MSQRSYPQSTYETKKLMHSSPMILLLLVIGVIFAWQQKDVSVQFSMNDVEDTYATDDVLAVDELYATLDDEIKTTTPTSNIRKMASRAYVEPQTVSASLANTYSNLTYETEGLGEKIAPEVKVEKRKKQELYIKKFAKVAQEEMKKYGIPASITIAQGLIESNCGESKLASKNNNHFGIKCFSKTCKKGHCSNFEDDSHKDFFRVYQSSWESYRAHSILLQKDRYKPLYDLKPTDYKSWAKGLSSAGYATDPKYGEKLIDLIENLQLYRLDKL